MGASAQLREQFGIGPSGEYGPDSADWLGVPMVAEGVVRGAVVVQSYDRTARYNEEDRALLGFVAQHILTALQRKQALEELERRVDDRTRALMAEVVERQRGETLQAALYTIADLASGELDMNEMLRRIHAVVAELMYARNLIIALYSPERQTLRFIYHADEKDPGLVDPEVEVPEAYMRDTMTLGVIRSGRAVMGRPAQVTVQLGIPEGVFVGAVAEDVLGVPMVSEGSVRGAVLVQSYDASERYGEEDRALLAYVAQHILTALDRKQAQAELEHRVADRTRELALVVGELREQISERERAEEQLMHETMHDSLTGLPNRSFLYSALERSLSRLERNPDHRFAVLFLDLDRFKVINDSVGHLAGDQMLKEAGARLAACVRPFDVVARLGGDEFAVLLEDVNLPEDACHVAQRAIVSLAEPMHVAGKELFTSASIGIALGHARYRRAEEVLRDADVAMYRAKAHGRQRFEIFDERLHEEALQLLEMESDLPSSAPSSSRTSSRSCAWAMNTSSATRPCCAGATRSAACSRPARSWAWRRRAAASNRSTGRCSKRPVVRSACSVPTAATSPSTYRPGISARRCWRGRCCSCSMPTTSRTSAFGWRSPRVRCSTIRSRCAPRWKPCATPGSWRRWTTSVPATRR